MATINTAGSGNQNAGGTWVGGVVPGPLDVPNILAGHAITNPTGVAWAVAGMQLAPGASFINNGTFTYSGDVKSTGTFTNPATFTNTGIVQPAAGASAAIYANGMRVRGRGTGPGTQRAKFRKNAAAAASIARDPANTSCYWGEIDFEFTRCEDLAEVASFHLLNWEPMTIRLHDTEMWNSPLTSGGFQLRDSGGYDFQGVNFNGHSAQCLTIAGSDDPASGVVRVMTRVSFDTVAEIDAPQGHFTHVHFADGYIMTGAWASWTECATGSTSGERVVCGSQNGVLDYANNPARDNWHGFIVSRPGTYAITRAWRDGIVGNDNGEFYLAGEPGAATVFTLERCGGTKSPLPSGSYGVFANANGNANISFGAENVTWFTDDGESGIVNAGETYAGYPGMITKGKSLLAVGLTAGNGVVHRRGAAAETAGVINLVSPANLTNNVCFNPIAGGTNLGVGNKNTSGGAGAAFSSTPAAPLNENPEFVDPDINLAKFFRSVVGGTPGTRSADMTLWVTAMKNMYSDAATPGITIPAAIDALEAGLTPTNPALKTDVSTINDGWVGATPGATGGATLVPTTLHVVEPRPEFTFGEVITPPLQIEVLDQFGDRLESYTGPVNVTDVDLGVAVTGTTPRNAVAGVATFNDLVPSQPPSQLGAPTVTAGTPVDATNTRTVPITTSGPGSWPSGVVVQLQTQRGLGAWVNAGTSTGSTSLVFTRESSDFTVQVRGIATHGGAPTDSTPSAPFTITVPAVVSVPALEDATPLSCEVTLYPGSEVAVSATAGGAQQELIGRADSDNVLIVRNIRRVIEGDAHTPSSVSYVLDGPEGYVASDTIEGTAGVYRIGISRLAFAPALGTLVLRLVLEAQDQSVTTLQFLVPQGVRA